MMAEHTLVVLSIIVIVMNLLVMAMVATNSYIVQRKVKKFTIQQTEVNKTLLENLDTFSKIYVGMEAKINSNKKSITDNLRLMMLTSRMVLEIRQSLSAWIAEQSPKDALEEGAIAGRAEEALAMAKKETLKPPPIQDDEPADVAAEIEKSSSTPMPGV